MFRAKGYAKTKIRGAATLLELIYHSTVRNMRQGSTSAVTGLVSTTLKAMLMVGIFYVMFELLGLRDVAVRGDFMLYVMSGIFLFITHNAGIGAVAGSESPTSPMMQHAPMNTVVSIVSSALAALYQQTLAVLIILLIYYTAVRPFGFQDPIGALMMYLLAWFSGCAIGMIFLALKPWFPGFVGVAQMVYTRANMITSGKMFLANSMPPTMVAMFDWNPLFHAIDQARGYTFINYNPHYSNWEYPLYLALTLIMIGLMGEFYTRQRASASWGARG